MDQSLFRFCRRAHHHLVQARFSAIILVAVDAVVRTLIRMKFTRRKLLEWETASEAEQDESDGTHLVDVYLKWTLPLSLATGVMIAFAQPSSLPIALPFLLLWGSSNFICKWLNKPQSA